jgi:hypothetical protein
VAIGPATTVAGGAVWPGAWPVEAARGGQRGRLQRHGLGLDGGDSRVDVTTQTGAVVAEAGGERRGVVEVLDAFGAVAIGAEEGAQVETN